MRIIGGLYRHRNIDFPLNAKTRPTKDMVRQGIFNAIAPDINGKTVLDLFAGSGAMGIEAISRGASKAIFIDHDYEAISCIKKNLSSLNITAFEVYRMEAQKALDFFASKQYVFDVVFLDPPYAENLFVLIIGRLINEGLLAQNGIIVLENQKPIIPDAIPFRKIKTYHYGITDVTILWR